MEQRVLKRTKCRFEELEIWKLSVEIAGELEQKKSFRFAEQLRGAGISIPNNIAAGAGNTPHKEFAQFLKIARRSIFENANMITIFTRSGLISQEHKDNILEKLDILCRKISAFQKTLK